MGKYRAGAVSGISFALACLACLGSGPWSHWRASGGMYIAGAMLGGLAAFITTSVRHARRSTSRGTTGALAEPAVKRQSGSSQSITTGVLRPDMRPLQCRIRQAFVASISRGTSSPWAQVVATASDIGSVATGAPLGVFSQVARTLTTLYQYYRVKKIKAQLAPKRWEVEITLPGMAP
jgi:hypothetical protein